MAETETQVRSHPDIFSAEEAAAYLHLDSVRGLETLRSKYGLRGYAIANKAMMYHRSDLDRTALEMFGIDKTKSNVRDGHLRIAGQRA